MFAKKGALNVVAGFSPRRRPCEIVETRAKAGDYIPKGEHPVSSLVSSFPVRKIVAIELAQ